MTHLINGLELSKSFFHQAVKPILDAKFPGLRYSAALIGSGSEVLGFDDEMSQDHDWGPRVMLFLTEGDYQNKQVELAAAMQTGLPHSFQGYPTHFELHPNGSRIMQPVGDEATFHPRIEFFSLHSYFLDFLNWDIHSQIEPADWLTFPEQKLLAVTSGAVFTDALGLEAVRQRLQYFPQDVWLYLLAAGWTRIGQEEHLMGRAGLAGDEIGSTLIANRLVRDLMRLWFLMEKQYAPYPKWFGTAFRLLPGAEKLAPILRLVQTTLYWHQRQQHLATAYELVAERHNQLGITDEMPSHAKEFYDRPFVVIEGERFAKAILSKINDPVMQAISRCRIIGSIDQLSDNTDLLNDPGRRFMLRNLYSCETID